jgi:hypothetical protein
LARNLCALAAELLVRIHVANKLDRDNFTRKGNRAMGLDLGFRALLELCLAENDRRFARYDDRLLRPQLLARPVRLVEALLGRSQRSA